MIDQSYGRVTRMDFLGPLIGARSESLINTAVGWKPDSPRVFLKQRPISYRIVVEAGKIENPVQDNNR
jgi:hypothetical protein